jgi:hypothetical protein
MLDPEADGFYEQDSETLFDRRPSAWSDMRERKASTRCCQRGLTKMKMGSDENHHALQYG